jgi:heme/copper-type cytochrome/quinol oxidase subunit 1
MFGDSQYYNCLITSHAMLMIFFFIMPSVLAGLANLWLPNLLGVPDMVFPKLNNFGMVILGPAWSLLMLAGQLDEGCGTA